MIMTKIVYRAELECVRIRQEKLSFNFRYGITFDEAGINANPVEIRRCFLVSFKKSG